MPLSKTQTKRLGGILAIMFKDHIPDENLRELIDQDFVKLQNNEYVLTPRGLDEKNRLCTLAGLNIVYASEKSKKVSKK